MSGPELPEHKLHQDSLGAWFRGYVATARRAGRIAYVSLVALLLGWSLAAFAPRMVRGDTQRAGQVAQWMGNTGVGVGVSGLAFAAYLSRRDRIAVLGLVESSTQPMTAERYAQALARRKAAQHLWVFAEGGFDPGIPAGDTTVRRFAGTQLVEVTTKPAPVEPPASA